MKKYIDLEEACAAMRKLDEDDFELYGVKIAEGFDGDRAVEALTAIPAADVREVVLCLDCQNSYEWGNVDGDSYRYCGYLRSRWNHDADRMVGDDDFCKWGRKREES